MSGRAELLARVRAAIGDAPAPPPTPRTYRRVGALTADERLGLFCERVADYRARVVRARPESVAGAVESVASGLRLCVPEGVPAEWVPESVRVERDRGLAAAELDALDGVLTGCTVAIAETGTIVLTSAPDEGRRAVTLVPDLHVVVVEERRIVQLVAEGLETVVPLVRDGRRPVTFVSGPSATSDIELDRVEGVHGPRSLVVVVATERVGSEP